MNRVHRPARILAPYLKKEWRALGLATLATILITLAELANPVPLALVVNRLFEESGTPRGFELTRSDLWLLAVIAGLVIGLRCRSARVVLERHLK